MRLVTILALLLACTGAASAQERWAAQASSNESNAPVAWGSTSNEAAIKALAACNAVSDTCGKQPSVTSDMRRVFVTMCCTSPRVGCLVRHNATVAEAEAGARQTFANAGFSSCRVTRRVSAGTGR